ncbi:hypothetical protein V8D89_009996 [Ganoderma adspersum]
MRCGTIHLFCYVTLPIASTMVLRPVGRFFSLPPIIVSTAASILGVVARRLCKKRFVCMERMIFVCCRSRLPIIVKMPCACECGMNLGRKGLCNMGEKSYNCP